MGKLDNKVAIVTGASKGIGAGIAERLAADGAKVVVNYSRSAQAASEVVKRIEASGGTAVAIQADVANPSDILKLFAETKAKVGVADILVNNAGVYAGDGIDAVTPESFDRHFAVNVKGLLLATQAAVRQFPKEGGVVVNISSTAAQTPPATMHVYSSTKGAVDSLTRSLALELGVRNIRVVGISPGATATEGVAEIGLPQEALDGYVARTPLGRIGTPQDIARAVSFVVSSDGAWITGETLQVGGGLRL